MGVELSPSRMVIPDFSDGGGREVHRRASYGVVFSMRRALVRLSNFIVHHCPGEVACQLSML